MANILVIDDTPFWRELAADVLKQLGYTVHCAEDGLNGLELLRQNGANLILLDVEMPHMEGLAFLEQIRRSDQWKHVPVIMLTGDMRKEHVLQAKKLGVVDYLLKARFSPAYLLERIQRCLKPMVQSGTNSIEGAAPPSPKPEIKSTATEPSSPRAIASGYPALLDRDRSLARARQALNGRTLSGVVAEVIALTASSRVDMPGLAASIARDSLLSVQVLRAANTANYVTHHGTIANLSEAVRNLGCLAVRNIAAALGVFEAMAPTSPDGFNPIRCWQHSFTVATLCSLFSAEPTSGLPYLIGLCHDLGEILFRTHFADEYQQVLTVQQTTGEPRQIIEKAMLGVTHSELAITILNSFQLPKSLCVPIQEYHANGPASRGGSNWVRLLRLADLYANGMLLACSGQSPVGPVNLADVRAATGKNNPPHPDADLLRAEIFSLTAVLARLPTREQAEVLAAPYPRRSVRIWLARSETFAALDPLETALRSLAEVTVSVKLPNADEAAEHDGLVVAAPSTSLSGFTGPEIEKAATRHRVAPLPVLWLTGRIEPGPLPVQPQISPMPLDRLANFVSSIEPQPPFKPVTQTQFPPVNPI
ncbi:MAG TPA: HDOD domain-containing protein [Tepidisphaeraceae bacterium]|nr:HDOD domain-containing protein [Tepidisphaeraceae bacterium]